MKVSRTKVLTRGQNRWSGSARKPWGGGGGGADFILCAQSAPLPWSRGWNPREPTPWVLATSIRCPQIAVIEIFDTIKHWKDDVQCQSLSFTSVADTGGGGGAQQARAPLKLDQLCVFFQFVIRMLKHKAQIAAREGIRKIKRTLDPCRK